MNDVETTTPATTNKIDLIEILDKHHGYEALFASFIAQLRPLLKQWEPAKFTDNAVSDDELLRALDEVLAYRVDIGREMDFYDQQRAMARLRAENKDNFEEIPF